MAKGNWMGKTTPSKEYLQKIIEDRRRFLEEYSESPYLGFDDLDAALEECKYSSQPEVLARLLNGENVFVSGLAGAGKTTVIDTFKKILDAEFQGGIDVAITASTGIAANLIGGTTIHSWAGLGISKEPFDPKNIEASVKARGYSKVFQNVKVLIIDEISMMPAYLFTKLDQILKFYRQDNAPFGGVQLVLIGDFLQLPPVVRKDDNVDGRFCAETQEWREAKIRCCFLDKTYRARDARLKKVLEEISVGKVSAETKALINSRIGVPKDPNKVYATLYTTNNNVEKYNREQLSSNYNPPMYYNYDSEGQAHNVEKLLKSTKIPETIELKHGAVVMLTVNTNVSGQMVPNGSIGEVIGLSYEGPVVRFNSGIVTTIRQKTYYLTEKVTQIDKVSGKEIVFEAELANVSQFPLKLAYAITVHKSQGQTFDGVVVDLRKCFQPGLGYVALSRVADLDDVIVEGIAPSAFYVNETSRKISKAVKKYALAGRKQFEKNKDSYDALLTNSIARMSVWSQFVDDDFDSDFN